MAGCFPAAPVINDWQGFDQRVSKIESQWGTSPATGGHKFHWKVERPRKVGGSGEGQFPAK